MGTYNAKVSFKGEGSFDFILPNYGEVQIFAGRDIYIKGLTQEGVEALRGLRPLLLEHKLNAKPDGCYKVIELETNKATVQSKMQYNYRPVERTASVADLKAGLKAGPISEEELKEALESTKVETVIEETTKTEEQPKENLNPGDYVLTSTKHKGKKISDLSSMQIAGNMNKFNAEDLIAIEAFKESKK